MHRTTLVGVGLLLFALPMAAAQPVPAPPDVQVSTPNDVYLVMPETGSAVVPFEVAIRCTPESYSTDLTHVSIAFDQQPAFASIVPTPARVSYADDPTECLNLATESVRVIPFNVTVQVTREAPAFQDLGIAFDIKLKRGSQTFGPYEGAFPVQADYLAAIEAVPVQWQISLGPNEQGKIPVDVTNLGNGDTVIHSQTRPTSANELSAVLAPSPFILESHATHGASAVASRTVYVLVRTPAGVGLGTDYTFDLELTGMYAGQGADASDTKVVELAVTMGGPSDPMEAADALAPGPGTAVMASALLAALAWQGSRRKDAP